MRSYFAQHGMRKVRAAEDVVQCVLTAVEIDLALVVHACEGASECTQLRVPLTISQEFLVKALPT